MKDNFFKDVLLTTGKLAEAKKYWMDKLSGELIKTSFPYDCKTSKGSKGETNVLNFILPEDLSKRLLKLSSGNDRNLYVVLMTGLIGLLYKYTGNGDIIIGTPIYKQTVEGEFINTVLAIRNKLTGSTTYKELLYSVREAVEKASVHQNYPINKLIEDLNINVSNEGFPLFDSLLMLENLHDREYISHIDVNTLFVFGKTAEQIFGTIEYNSLLYERETISRIASHFISFLSECLKNIDCSIKEIDFLSKEERQQILFDFNNTKRIYESGKTISELFEEQVLKTPDAIALVYEDKQMTYQQLNEKSNQIAKILREKGVCPESIVGIVAERSLEMVIGIMAVLKSGGAYLPIDPNYPEDRINYMLEDSKASVILTQCSIPGSILFDGVIIDLNDKGLYIRDRSNLDKINSAKDLAYVIYTSGTTGNPKGVMVEHGSFSETIQWRRDEYGLNADDSVLQLFSFSFDGFVTSFFTPIISGSKVVLLTDNDSKNPDAIKCKISEQAITHFICIPLLYSAILDCISVEEAKSLRIVTLAGDKLSSETVRKSKKVSRSLEIVNEYGPTECTVVSTICRNIEENQKITIGKPANTSIYILDNDGKVLPVGAEGEMCISGSKIARGYLNRPDLTSEKFLQNPYSMDERMYKTGDLARWLPDGNIEFIGRIDYQVKIMGHRIEPGEIEAQLLKHEKVKEAVVIDGKDKNGNKYLCAYIVSNEEIELNNVREYLSGKLPHYMVPAHFVQLEKLPLNTSGKVDRNALPDPDESMDAERNYAAPTNEAEEKLAEIWQEILRIEKVGINDNFFRLGGDSIKAIQLSSRLRKNGMKVEVKDIFTLQTIKELVKRIKKDDCKKDQGIVEGNIPLTPVQKWFFESNTEDLKHFNQAVMLYRKEGFDESKIRQVFNQIVKHHDALRMVYRFEENQIVQYNRGIEDGQYSLEVIDLIKESEYVKKAEEYANRIQESMDLTNGPLVRLGLIKTAEGDHLLIAIHHLVVDGISWRIILEDFAAGYEVADKGKEIVFQDKSDSYMKWANMLLEYADSDELEEEYAYWEKICKEEIRSLKRDGSKKEGRIKDSLIFEIELDKDETQKLLTSVNRAYNTEINDILLTALGYSLKEYTGEDRIFIELEGHGRENVVQGIDISRTIGWFTSAYPVMLNMSKTEDMPNQIKLVKEGLRSIPKRGVGYGIVKYLKHDQKSINKAFKPEIGFNYLGQFDSDINNELFELSHLGTGASQSQETKRHHALEINGIVVEGKFKLSLNYDKEEFKESTIEQIAVRYMKFIREITEHCIAKETGELTPSDLSSEGISIEETVEVYRKASAYGEIKDIYYLTPMQEGMLFHNLMNRESGAYFEQSILTVSGDIDRELLLQSFNIVTKRHDILRTIIVHEGFKKPLQVVFKERKAEVAFEYIIDDEECEKRIKEIKEKDSKRRFDLSKDRLMRATVIKTGKEEWTIIWSFHHIIMDGWCLGIIAKEIFKVYSLLKSSMGVCWKAFDEVLGEAYAYGNYIKWLGNQDKDAASKYWKDYLKGYEQQAVLPRKRAEEANCAYYRAEYDFSIEESITEKLKAIGYDNSVTINTLMQAVWGIILRRYNNTEDVVFGSVVSVRPSEVEGIEQMVGLFINAVPVRVQGSRAKKFTDLLKQIQQESLNSKAYEYMSLAEIQSGSDLKQSLIDHILVFENYPVEKELGKEKGTGFDIQKYEAFEQSNYDLNVIVALGEKLDIKLNYNGAVYDSGMMERTAGHIRKVLLKVAQNPSILLEDMDIVTEEEKEYILHKYNDTFENYDYKKFMHKLFEEQVERTPGNTAVINGKATLTYKELNEMANQVARYLVECEVKPNDFVGVMGNRTIETVVNVMAILKAGASYIPIDASYPEERKKYIVENSRCKLVLDPECYQKNNCCNYSVDNLNIETSPSDIAYIIYTSGSTGMPKGVIITHEAAVNTIIDINQKFSVNECDRIIGLSSLCFDLSVYDIFGALSTGAALVIVEDQRDSRELTQKIKACGITIWNSVPAIMEMLVDNVEADFSNSSLRLFMMSGDWIPLKLPEKIKNHFANAKMYSLGGATEASIWSIHYPIESVEDSWRSIPYGMPLANQKFYVLDSCRRLCPVGVLGELYIGGVGVAKGYMNDPEKTANAFINHPELGYIYRTGDQGILWPEGYIEFMGRVDQQVKIRGYRIELGEIEAQLAKFEEIKEAVVVVREDDDSGKFLCAYIVSEEEIKAALIRETLSKVLPDYMIPSYFVQLDRLPLTSNGKIDRKSLPKPEGGIVTGTLYEAPLNAIQEKLHNIWSELLGLERIGINDNFFELGGHSLKIISLASKIHKELGVEVPLKHLFEKQSIKELAQFIESNNTSEFIEIDPLEEQEYYLLTQEQKRLYIMSKFESNTANNLPTAFLVEGNLAVNKLEEVFGKLIVRHETLRTSFHMVDDEPMQKVHDSIDFKIEFYEAKKACEKDIINNFVRPFDLSIAPLFRVGLIKLNEQKYVLLFDMHHIISDDSSMSIFVREFISLYSGNALPDLRIQYKDYAAWEKKLIEAGKMKEKEDYWLKRFSGEIPELSLRTDYPSSPTQAIEGDRIEYELDFDIVEGLNNIMAATDTTLYMVMLAAFNILLLKYTTQEDIIIGSPVSGRKHTDLDNTIGVFVNLLPMRNHPRNEVSYKDFLSEIKINTLDVFENQEYQFEELVRKLKIKRKAGKNPLFDVVLSVTNNKGVDMKINDLEFKPYPINNDIARFDLTVFATQIDNRINVTFRYSKAVYKRTTVEGMLKNFVEILRRICSDMNVRINDIDIFDNLLKVESRVDIDTDFNF
ncbi:non-ribosomal peptide synthetase [Acetivibrio cellulolyticus]|uniref:non-ribosomal peptide synthetase n=1 Tax=Acetivibrio cellulolyticus TaxID=35830 RepID=UPI0002481B99|nr:non-ribosomal peptide synthetase [Acetivibrio cellulolyticus]